MPQRSSFGQKLATTIGQDPYGHGSSPVGGDHDRRDATIGAAIVRYAVSGSVLTVTVVRLLY
ncbi:hypothetical protein [Streptomyces sp. JJ38]|uniref:hypothetical protein n=1 Tax=Streptomyces sp. JJ38 TaxID=2738128 RepID=UPI001C58B44E|nr:hypothetical protein [Streptomyces sp. JJ38]MBW1600051.1 hypothetical protein [Streptomyces sp. JJ38]